MGTHQLSESVDVAAFIRAVLEDLDALERMVGSADWDETARLGAEQEFMLIHPHATPASVAPAVLEHLADEPRFTFEVARWQLEANLTPRTLREGDALGALMEELSALSARARAAAAREGAELLLSGLPPAFEVCHSGPEELMPHPRYAAFDRATLQSRNGRLPIMIQGIESLNAWVDSISTEASATSFQVHLQVPAREFTRTFNCALLAAAPMMAACANSPIFAGRRLWHETRIPLLELAADIRSASWLRRGGLSRTFLSDGWFGDSLVEVLRRDLARYAPIIACPQTESSLEVLARGEVPALRAFTTFNSAVWRWMRPCYGVTAGRPHLRIENRILPSGPTIRDEVANTAFFVGLMHALPEEVGDVRSLPFDEADVNFHAAARRGLDAQLAWLDGERIGARDLLLERLIPLARAGLASLGMRSQTASRAMDDFEERVASGQTGAAWMLKTWGTLDPSLSRRERAFWIASELKERCWSEEPVHRWRPAVSPRLATAFDREPPATAALDTRFFAFAPEVPIELAERVFADGQVGAVAVEDADGTLLGLLLPEDVERWREAAGPGATGSLREALVERELVNLEPSCSARQAAQRLAEAGQPCAVVLARGHLLGLVLAERLSRLLHDEPGQPEPLLPAEASC